MKKTIKLMSGVLALAMCFSAMPMSAFAEQVEDQTLTANDTASVEVVISTASQYEVKIPKKLTLTVPATQNAEIPYTYMVKGSIAGNEQVKVVPDATVTMQQEGKEDNEGTITQDKQVWSCSDFETLNGSNAAEIVWSEATPGNILVENMSAGVWNGTFNFNIALEEAPKLITFEVETIADGSFQAEEGMTWEEWLNSEYNTKGFSITEYGISAGDGTGGVLRIQSTLVEVKISDKIIANEVYDTGAPDL